MYGWIVSLRVIGKIFQIILCFDSESFRASGRRRESGTPRAFRAFRLREAFGVFGSAVPHLRGRVSLVRFYKQDGNGKCFVEKKLPAETVGSAGEK